MQEGWEETWTITAFADMLTDAIMFDVDAYKFTDSDFSEENRYAKAAILNAILSVECAANCCVARMKYPPLVLDQIDKLSVINKYDLLYSARYNKKLDRGSKAIQSIQELFGLRNKYVHPKIQKVTNKMSVNEKGEKTYERSPEHTKYTQVLRLPHDFNTWTTENSRTVLKAILTFFNYFFSELCGLDSESSSKLLLVNAKGPQNTASFLAEHQVEHT